MIRWVDVDPIVAYKRDFFTTDMVCLDLYTTDGMRYVNEDMLGFWEVLESKPTYLPLFERDFWNTVVLPAFATNITVVYERY